MYFVSIIYQFKAIHLFTKCFLFTLIDSHPIMRNSHKLNQFSADTLNRNDLQLDDFHDNQNYKNIDQMDNPFETIRKSSKKNSFINPFISNRNSSPSEEQQFHFENLSSKNLNNQQQHRLSRSNKKDNSDFNHKTKTDHIKESSEFMFNGDGSGSLFSSQKTQNNEENNIDKYRNLQTYRKVLKEHYNDGYMKSTFQLIKRSTLGKSIRGSDAGNFITRQPILFHKKFYGSRSGYDLSGNYLCRLIGNKIYYKNVLSQQLHNTDGLLKCECIQLAVNQSVSPSIEIDSNSKHLFYYSNMSNEIVVLSLGKMRNIRDNNEICRVRVRMERKDPLLYLVEINKQVILLLIGGHIPLNPKYNTQDVEGCKYIEIFPIDEWGTGIMQSRVIKLINGKIYPLIIFPIRIQNSDSLLLIGGNAMGKIVSGKLSFKQHKVLNRSSNFRAVYINTKQIVECIEQGKDIMSLPNLNNISVQIEDKVNLYKGYVDYVRSSQKEKIRIFLPEMKEFYTLKMLKKQLRIIRSNDIHQRLLTFDSNDQYHHLEMKCFKQPMIKYYQINSKGIFQEKIIQLSNTNFRIKQKCRCPCEFM